MKTHRLVFPQIVVIIVLMTIAVIIAGASLAAAHSTPRSNESLGDQVSDVLLELKVRTLLLSKMGWDASGVSPQANQGRIVLSGHVKDHASAATAEDIVKTIEGVKGTHSDLKITGPSAAGNAVSRTVQETERGIGDGLLELKLKTRLIEELGKAGLKVEVEAHDGIVNLSGTVPDNARRDQALQVVGKSDGVKRVIDLLKVRE